MSAYAKLPALLERIETLESGTTLCRRRYCYAETFSWMSPYCAPECTPAYLRTRQVWLDAIAEAFDVPAEFIDTSPRADSNGWGGESFEVNRYALMADWRISSYWPVQHPESLIHISSAC